jgi:hypothetical protein
MILIDPVPDYKLQELVINQGDTLSSKALTEFLRLTAVFLPLEISLTRFLIKKIHNAARTRCISAPDYVIPNHSCGPTEFSALESLISSR